MPTITLTISDEDAAALDRWNMGEADDISSNAERACVLKRLIDRRIAAEQDRARLREQAESIPRPELFRELARTLAERGNVAAIVLGDDGPQVVVDEKEFGQEVALIGGKWDRKVVCSGDDLAIWLRNHMIDFGFLDGGRTEAMMEWLRTTDPGDLRQGIDCIDWNEVAMNWALFAARTGSCSPLRLMSMIICDDL